MVDHLECARILAVKATVKSGREPQVNGGRQAPEWTDRVTGVLEACKKGFSKRARSLQGKRIYRRSLGGCGMSRPQFFQAIFISHNHYRRFLRWLLSGGFAARASFAGWSF